jgi:septation ring formation regulator EzrA
MTRVGGKNKVKEENMVKNTPEVESYRLNQVEEALRRIEDKIDKWSATFATRDALGRAIADRERAVKQLDERVSALENKKRLQTTITYVILGCSLVANLFMVDEIFTKGV